jgi:hypothetical protein
MEAALTTLGACKAILGNAEFVAQLTPLWEAKLLHHTVEAVSLETEFVPLFTDDERREAWRRLYALPYGDGKRATDDLTPHRGSPIGRGQRRDPGPERSCYRRFPDARSRTLRAQALNFCPATSAARRSRSASARVT